MSPQNMKTRELRQNIQLVQSVWAESRTITLYSSIVNRHDFLSIPTGSAVCIWRNILVFHFAELPIYTTYLSMELSIQSILATVPALHVRHINDAVLKQEEVFLFVYSS